MSAKNHVSRPPTYAGDEAGLALPQDVQDQRPVPDLPRPDAVDGPSPAPALRDGVDDKPAPSAPASANGSQPAEKADRDDPAPDTIDAPGYESKTVEELRFLLRQRGLKVSGDKESLIDRLEDDDQEKAK